MREIKFRGKTGNGDKWLFGYLIKNSDGKCYIKDTDYNVNNGRIDIIPELVAPESVGQFTGLLDKNGKEIFEGDLLDILFGNPKNIRYDSDDISNGQYLHHNVEVYWDANRLMWSVKGGNLLSSWDSNSLTGYAFAKYEIVGNIYENPELSKVDAKA